MDHRPPGARVAINMIGSTTDSQQIDWNERDTMLYALGVGAGLGNPAGDLRYTTENSQGFGLRALPSMLSLLTTDSKPPALAGLDVARFLHAEQRIELLQPLPAAGRGTLRSTITAVWDKGEHAIVVNTSTIRLGDMDGPLVGRSTMYLFVRGGGGFGGERGESRPKINLDRRPHLTVVQRWLGKSGQRG